MDTVNDVVIWAWARHHNILSWYIRPLFLIPFCYFAYRRSGKGMVGTLIALATSMFWFPAPAQPDPQVIAFLHAERAYLVSPWTPQKLVLSLVVPGFFLLLGLAFWRRSWWYGLGIINAMIGAKFIWGMVFAGDTWYAILPPALLGMAVCNVAVLGLRWRSSARLGR